MSVNLQTDDGLKYINFKYIGKLIMPHFLPKIIRDFPSVLLKLCGEPSVPESERPVFTKSGIILLILFGAIIFGILYYFMPTTMSMKGCLSIYCFGLSAFLWFAAATIPTPLPMAYVSGPPSKVITRANYQTRFNQIGAVFTAVGLILQNI
jgi:hypothetical protein